MLMQAVWFALGLFLAVIFVLYARRNDSRHEQTILGLGLIGAALIYVGFAALWGDSRWIAIEIVGVALYGLFYLLSKRHAPYWLAVGWAAHPLWDFFLHWIGPGHTVAPEWYVIACLSFDIVVAGYILSRINIWKVNQPVSNSL